MPTIIHKPSEIQVGKLYKVKNKDYYDRVLYLGVEHPTRDEKLLVIVMDDSCNLIGKCVIPPTDEDDNPTSLWLLGFELQES